MSTEVTFWHSAEYGSDFRRNSGEIPRNSAEFPGISPEFSRNHFRSQKIPRNSVLAEFRGHPMRNTIATVLQYASMFYTAPCVMLLMRAALRPSGRGVGPWKLRIFGPVKWHRADRRVPFHLGTKKLRFPGPNPLLLA